MSLLQASVYGDSGREPLLVDQGGAVEQHDDDDMQEMDEPTYVSFKRSSLFLGLLVGFFIQFSTLGANYAVISIWGEEVLTNNQHDIVIFSLAWSFFTSAMAILVLAFLRRLVSASYSGDRFDEMVLHMECRFVVGALVGVCSAWAATDVILGMSAQIVYSLVTLVAALSWCQFMMWLFAPAEPPAAARAIDSRPSVLMIV